MSFGSSNKLRLGVFIALSSVLYFLFAYVIHRSDFLIFILTYSGLFVSYFYGLKRLSLKTNFILFSGILFRSVFIFSIPALSDDFYRFIWDGHLVANFISPYSMLPTAVEIDFPNKALLLEKMNSPSYYSVYPSVLQFIFGSAASIFPNSILGGIVFMRSIILIAELGSFFLLRNILGSFGISKERTAIYFLNPLVIIELSGNLHFEALMIFFSLFAIYLLVKKKSMVLSALSLSMAFLSKLIPILLIPLFWRSLSIKRAFVFSILFAASSLLLLFSILSFEDLHKMGSSLDLYFRTFEFNASIYYLFREIGYWLEGFNLIAIIGPGLALISAFSIIYFTLVKDKVNIRVQLVHLMIATTIFYLLSTTIHPWYLSFLILLGSFGNYLYPIAWSALIFFSYSAYANQEYSESTVFLLLEYLPLYILLGIEWKQKGILDRFLSQGLYLPNKNAV